MNTKEYLEHVYSLEKSCYQQQILITMLKRKMGNLQNPKLKEKVTAKNKNELMSLWMSLSTLLFTGILFSIFSLFSEFWSQSVTVGPIKTNVATVGCFLAAGVVFLVCYFAFDRPAGKEYKRDLKTATKTNEQIEYMNQATIEAIPGRIAVIKKQLDEALTAYQNTRLVLSKFYDANILYPKYRSLVPVTMFYEYFSSGRCNQLEGHEGAYNLYENELRLNLILGKLDDIINRLDQIRDNQYMLVNAILECNRQAEKTYQLLQNVEANTAASAYFSQISAVNTTYLAWLKKYR